MVVWLLVALSRGCAATCGGDPQRIAPHVRVWHALAKERLDVAFMRLLTRRLLLCVAQSDGLNAPGMSLGLAGGLSERQNESEVRSSNEHSRLNRHHADPRCR